MEKGGYFWIPLLIINNSGIRGEKLIYIFHEPDPSLGCWNRFGMKVLHTVLDPITSSSSRVEEKVR